MARRKMKTISDDGGQSASERGKWDSPPRDCQNMGSSRKFEPIDQ